jgi:hypothetical protein
MIRWLDGIFHVDLDLVFAVWILFGAMFHFSQAVKPKTEGNPYLTLCVQLGMFMNIVWLATGAAYFYNFGFWEFVKLLLACLAIPLISWPVTATAGGKTWDRVALYIGMPIAIAAIVYIFPRLNWFGLI